MRLLDRLGSRPMVIVAGWIVAAVLAVLVGIVGIGVVGAGLTSRQGSPISERDVERALGAETEPSGPSGPAESSESSGPAESSGPSPASAETVRSFATAGGTVVASCDAITSMAPAQGWSVHEQDDDEGEFRGIRDDHARVKVELSCSGGVPQLRVREENDD